MFQDLTPSKYSCGYDQKFKEEETIAIVERAKQALLDGHTQYFVAKTLALELDIKTLYARAIVTRAFKELSKEGTKREEGMLEKNLQRLEHIYGRAMDTGDLKQAIAALDTINKLLHLYKEKIEVSSDDFVFKIGE